MAGHIKLHGLGDSDNHSSCTVAELNALISDGTFGGGLYDIEYLTGGYTLTTLWANVGNNMSITAPASGTYKVTANVCMNIFGDTIEIAGGAIRFHNGTSIKGSAVMRSDIDPVNTDWNTTIRVNVALVDIFTCTSGETINLQAYKFDSTSTVSIYQNSAAIGSIMMEKI